jgi:hypothetical protein
MKNYGLKFDEFNPNHYFLGGKFLGTTVINPNGDWTNFVPYPKYQSRPSFDTDACTIFGTNNVIETLISFIFHEDKILSNRFLAIVSGASRTGNSPQVVAETLRNIGNIDDIELPFDSAILTEDMFYSPNPMTQSLLGKAKDFLKKYSIGHEWVYPIGTVQTIDIQNNLISQALKISPVGASVSAWHSDGQGGYDQTWPENHWIMIVKDLGIYWYCYDSYDKCFKKYSKKSNITMAKIYMVQKLIVEDSTTIFIKFWNWVKNLLNKQVVADTVIPTTVTVTTTDMNKIKVGLFCLAIQTFEGYVLPGQIGRDGKIYVNGSRSYINCNPGNLKWRQGMVYAIGQDIDGFAKFATYKDGFLALNDKVINACTGKSLVYFPTDTISIFFKKYSNDQNEAIFVAKKLGVDVSFQIKNLIV